MKIKSIPFFSFLILSLFASSAVRAELHSANPKIGDFVEYEILKLDGSTDYISRAAITNYDSSQDRFMVEYSGDGDTRQNWVARNEFQDSATFIENTLVHCEEIGGVLKNVIAGSGKIIRSCKLKDYMGAGVYSVGDILGAFSETYFTDSNGNELGVWMRVKDFGFGQ